MIKKISASQPNVFIDNKQINQVYECKTLVVTVDQHLSWKCDTENICRKYAQKSRRFVESNLVIKNKHLFLFLTPLSALTSTKAVRYGMYPAKLDQNDFKNYKIGLLELY